MNTIFYLKSTKYKVLSIKTKTANPFFRLFSILFSLFSLMALAQEKEKDTTKVNQLDEVLVSAVRVTTKTPVSFSNLDKKEIKYRNLGQDIPILMNFLPSVVTTSDAGNGVGYTGIRVRGSDATRVNVTINGIPYNDSESHGTYWVNMPDFASSLESIQLQRGVGTSTNGAGAFGASLNMLTDTFSEKASGEIANSFGSFNTMKNTVKFSTGLMNDRFEIAGRLSNLKSDGYIDRASSNLKSYFLQGTYIENSTLIKALVFGGTEKTYQSWNGVDATTLATDRTFNSAGLFTDEFGQTRFYDNETDNYQQDHYQLHWNQKVSRNWSTNLAFHYTKGKGYFENYKEDATFADYGLLPVGLETTTDLIRQKWLDNDFYGTTFSANYKSKKLDVILGGGWNKYEGEHFGKVIWARYASQSELDDRYYEFYGNKTDFNSYAKFNYKLSSKWSLFGDLQYRNVGYKANGVLANKINEEYNFINPKAGLTFDLNKTNSFYFSYSKANKEPNRTDFENGVPKPESLDDIELGWRMKTAKVSINTNFYLMYYKNQLIKTGQIDDVGNEIRANVDKSYRTGIEIDAQIKIGKQFVFSPNITISNNKIKDYKVDTGSGLIDYGNTNIAFSPNLIAGGILSFEPIKNLQLSLLNKYVGSQFAGNFDTEVTKLKSYNVVDFNVNYEIKPNSIFKSIVISVLANNVLNVNYVSNAYLYGDSYVSYYPQAGANFLAGLSLKF
ncbi:MAG TPA: TonB-dependent receptor [Flavobacterium sp.]|nr:TonB-dependent receptor [Flavobacterium sp.]HAT76902.1 TonB-dependent receptor [Flavobacterium sp.]